MVKINCNQSVLIWLYLSAFMVFAMAVIGAVTRLSESGLSMVEWRPLIGAVPPLTDVEWVRVFKEYQASPEYQIKNFWMEMADFKRIFFWEWLHRLWGRLIGLVYAVPLFYFWARGRVPSGYGVRLFCILMLGAGQGLMGWYMVKSGLVDVGRVSHFRLAAHLGLAFIIFGALIWTAQDIAGAAKMHVSRWFKVMSWGVLYLIGVSVIWGAYVAGMDAGMVYNTFPLMGAYILPPDAVSAEPVWTNFFQNPVAIQFLHRVLGLSTFICVFILFFAARRRGLTTWEVYLLPVIALFQVGLGIATLLSQVWLPLATLHQVGALCLIGVMIVFVRKVS